MLVLTRKINETVIIDNHIKITIAAVEGDKVRLAIDAPRSVHILRQEVFEAIKEANEAAVNIALDLEGLSQLKDLLS